MLIACLWHACVNCWHGATATLKETNQQLATSTTIGDSKNNILRVPPKHTIYQNLTLALDIAFA